MRALTLSPRQLKSWRLAFLNGQTDQPMRTAEAAAYLAISQRSYQRYEAGTQPLPGWLARTVHYRHTPDGFYRRPR